MKKKHDCYRYNSTTGIFTVPPGGDGLYYFSVFFVVNADVRASFDMEVNGEYICTTTADQTENTNNEEPNSCSALYYVMEGTLS